MSKKIIATPDESALLASGWVLENAGDPVKFGTIYFIRQVHGRPRQDVATQKFVVESQRQVLQALIALGNKDVFPEGACEDEPPESWKAMTQASTVAGFSKKVFPSEHVPDKLNDLQSERLYAGGAELFYQDLNPDIYIHRTLPDKSTGEKIDALISSDCHRAVKWNEDVAVDQIKDYLAQNPGKKIALIFGAAHDFKARLNSGFNPRLLSKATDSARLSWQNKMYGEAMMLELASLAINHPQIIELCRGMFCDSILEPEIPLRKFIAQDPVGNPARLESLRQVLRTHLNQEPDISPKTRTSMEWLIEVIKNNIGEVDFTNQKAPGITGEIDLSLFGVRVVDRIEDPETYAFLVRLFRCSSGAALSAKCREIINENPAENPSKLDSLRSQLRNSVDKGRFEIDLKIKLVRIIHEINASRLRYLIERVHGPAAKQLATRKIVNPNFALPSKEAMRIENPDIYNFLDRLFKWNNDLSMLIECNELMNKLPKESPSRLRTLASLLQNGIKERRFYPDLERKFATIVRVILQAAARFEQPDTGPAVDTPRVGSSSHKASKVRAFGDCKSG